MSISKTMEWAMKSEEEKNTILNEMRMKEALRNQGYPERRIKKIMSYKTDKNLMKKQIKVGTILSALILEGYTNDQINSIFS